jgi:hypothetical protein
VQPPRVMLLDDEGQFFAGLLFLLSGYRLRSTRSVPFAPVCRELVHGMDLPTYTLAPTCAYRGQAAS